MCYFEIDIISGKKISYILVISPRPSMHWIKKKFSHAYEERSRHNKILRILDGSNENLQTLHREIPGPESNQQMKKTCRRLQCF